MEEDQEFNDTKSNVESSQKETFDFAQADFRTASVQIKSKLWKTLQPQYEVRTVDPRFKDLNDREKDMVQQVYWNIDEYYELIPKELIKKPEIQNKCLNFLSEAEKNLARDPVLRQTIIESKKNGYSS